METLLDPEKRLHWLPILNREDMQESSMDVLANCIVENGKELGSQRRVLQRRSFSVGNETRLTVEQSPAWKAASNFA
jgi:hypothetical protein